MPTINQLSATTSLTTSDKMVVYSNDNGDSRKATLSTLLDFLHDNFQEPGLYTTIVVPTVPSTIVLPTQTQNLWLVLNPAAPLTAAALTVALPNNASAFDGQEVSISTTQSITTLNITGNGASVMGQPGTLPAGGYFTLKYSVSQNQWYTTSVGNVSSFSTINVSTSINDGSNNEVITIGATASAVNQVVISNAATGDGPSVASMGSDTNIDLILSGKNSGKVKAGGIASSNEVVTIGGTQTLTSKTLTSPTITSPSISAATLTGTTTTAAVSLGGNVTPTVGNTYNVGSSGARLDYVYARNANISDNVSALSLTASSTVTANVVVADSVDSTLLVGYSTTQNPPAGTVGALTQRNATVASCSYDVSTGLAAKGYNVSGVTNPTTGSYQVSLYDAVSTDSAIIVTLGNISTTSGKVVYIEEAFFTNTTTIEVRIKEADLAGNTTAGINGSFHLVVIGSPATDRTL